MTASTESDHRERHQLDELLTQLEAAEAGSIRLEADIHCAVRGWVEIEHRHFHGTGFKDPDGNLRTWKDIPNYTTSLDAKLDGENIVVVHGPKQHGGAGGTFDMWQARHENEDGSHAHGYGHTETLARRCAALKAMIDG